MSTLEKMANAPSEFTVRDKVYTIKALSVLKIAYIRQQLLDFSKAEFKKDISDLVENVPEGDRVKYMMDALKSFKMSDSELEEMLMSRQGMVAVVSQALDVTTEESQEMLGDNELQDVMWEIFSFAMGIEEPEEVEEAVAPVDGENSDQGNG
jgi:hypothetical protein